MHLPSAVLAILLAAAPFVFADPEFSLPGPGAQVPGGTAFTVTWADSGNAPSIADLTAYQLFLFSGSNTKPQQLYSVANAAFSAGNTVQATVPLGIGGATVNAYFLGLVSTAAAGGTITTYSSRFTLTGMTGTFSADVQAALLTVTGTAGPPPVNQVANAAPVAPPAGQNPASGAAGAWGTPYNEQTGNTKYAPMQPVPPTAITATNTAPLWPTSSVVLASTFLPTPSIVTTLTQPNTFSVLSHANTAAPASQPTDDMQRFLNRWKD